jgi:hypothetical protein
MWFARISLAGMAIELPFAARAQAGRHGREARQTSTARYLILNTFFTFRVPKKGSS